MPTERGVSQSERKSRPDSLIVCHLSEYQGMSPRLNGLKKLQHVGAQTPDAIVLTDTLFRRWKENSGQLPPAAVEKLKGDYAWLTDQHPGKGLHMGRAFYVPGEDEPQGPRTADIQNGDDFIAEIEKFYHFIVEQTDYDRPDAEIALVTHPFINTIDPPLQARPRKPYPGGAAILKEDGTIEIEAVFGQDEGIQSITADVFTLKETEEAFTATINIGKKEAAMIPQGGRYKKVPLNQGIQEDRTLSNMEIVQIAEVLKRLKSEFGERHRVEFSASPDGLIFRECVPFPYTEKAEKETDITNQAIVIREQNDAEIRKLLEPFANKSAIAYLHPDLFEARNFDAIAHLGNQASTLDIELVVFAYGLFGATAHRVKNLKDHGFTVKFIGDRLLREGELVHAYTKDSEMRLEADPTKDLGEEPISRKLYGGKVLGMEALLKNGFTTPDGFKISVDVFRKHLEDARIQKEDLESLADFHKSGKKQEEFETLLAGLHELMLTTPLSHVHLHHIVAAASALGVDELSVRSSANCEDQAKQSFAGYFNSETHVVNNQEAIEQAVKKVLASVITAFVISGAEAHKLKFEDIEMGILVHERVDAEKQGVLYTTDENGRLMIEVGIEEDAVEGEAAQRMEFERSTGYVTKNHTRPNTEGLLSDKEGKNVFQYGEKIEKAFGGEPQDVEWAITEEGKTVFLQTRPLAGNGHS